MGASARTGRRWLPVAMLVIGLCSVASAAEPSPPPSEPELRKELLSRYQADQDIRGKITEWMKQFPPTEAPSLDAFFATLTAAQRIEFERLAETSRSTDLANTKWLQVVVEKHGFPTRSLVGRDGANAAWLLVQHADHDSKFQRRCLDLMAQLPQGEFAPQDLAYLTDRVLLAEGQPQRYGTQFSLIDGKCIPRPLEDEAHVDERRAAIGLPPLAQYLSESAAFYTQPAAGPP
jgi:hypothetical protein